MKAYNILVIGDIMLDRYIIGQHNRQSSEADIPIIDVDKKESKLGGASNVANNLSSLGMNPILLSIIGGDEAGESLKTLLAESGIDHHLFIDTNRKTTIKTRLVDENYNQFIRFDFEDTTPIENEVFILIQEALQNILNDKKVDAVIIQDYNKGLLSHDLISLVQKECKNRKIKLLVDPKKDNFKLLSDCDVFKPNFSEIKSFLGSKSIKKTKDSLIKSLEGKHLNSKKLIITLAESGVFYKNSDSTNVIPGHLIENPDVSGAGDSVISILSILELLDITLEQSAQIINHCGALVCKKQGVSTISKIELQEIINKIV